jgi:hypothetical protein
MAGIYADKPERDFVLVEPGTYVARCVHMYEIGTIEVDFGKGFQKIHKVRVEWELPEEKTVFSKDKGEEPFIVSKEYNLSMHKKSKLRKDLESWRGQPYEESQLEHVDVTAVLGKSCLLTIIHEPQKNDPSKKNAEVSSVTKLMKNQICPPQINPSRLLSFEKFDWEVYSSLSDWLKDKIAESQEFKKISGAQPRNDVPAGTGTSPDQVPGQPGGENPDDLPF